MPVRRVVEAWREFLDFISGAPPTLRTLLRLKVYCGPLNYRDRVYIAAFCFVNGFPPDLLADVLEINENYTVSKCNKVLDLYNYWAAEGDLGRERRNRYFAYAYHFGRVVSLNLELPGHVVRERLGGDPERGRAEVDRLQQVCGNVA